MTRGYGIFRQLDTGEIIKIASRNGLRDAQKLVESLQEEWPGIYLIQSACKEGVDNYSARLTAEDRTAINLDSGTRHYFIKNPGSFAYRN
jgi:hypothetical protein